MRGGCGSRQSRRRIARNVARDELIKAGEYVLDPQERSVTLRGNRIDLTTKEFQLVASLFNNVGKILSRDLLAMTAWGRELGVESRSLDTHIYRIRQKLKLRPFRETSPICKDRRIRVRCLRSMRLNFRVSPR